MRYKTQYLISYLIWPNKMRFQMSFLNSNVWYLTPFHGQRDKYRRSQISLILYFSMKDAKWWTQVINTWWTFCTACINLNSILYYFFQFFIRSHFENDVITLFLITYTCSSLVERWWKLRANFQRRWYCSAKVNHVVKHRLSLTEKRMYAHSKRIMKTSVKGIYFRKIRLENLIVIESTQ